MSFEVIDLGLEETSMKQPPICPRCGRDLIEIADRGGWEEVVGLGLFSSPYHVRVKIDDWVGRHEDDSSCPLTRGEALTIIGTVDP